MKRGLSLIIINLLFLSSISLAYFGNMSLKSYYLPFIFIFLSLIIVGFIELLEFRNKTFLGIILAIITLVMWIFVYMTPISPGVNLTFYYIETGLITLAIIVLAIFLPREWKKL